VDLEGAVGDVLLCCWSLFVLLVAFCAAVCCWWLFVMLCAAGGGFCNDAAVAVVAVDLAFSLYHVLGMAVRARADFEGMCCCAAGRFLCCWSLFVLLCVAGGGFCNAVAVAVAVD
jgi:hypothetical protein